MDTTTTSIEIPAQIRGYLESLIKDAGMDMVDQEFHEEMVKELFVQLDSYIISVIVDHMPSEHLEGFIQLHEAHRPQAEIEQYMKDHLPNASGVLTQAFMDFRDEYLGAAVISKEVPQSNTTGQ